MKNLSKKAKMILSLLLALILLISGTNLIVAFSSNIDKDINLDLLENKASTLGKSSNLGLSEPAAAPLGLSKTTFAVGDIITAMSSSTAAYPTYINPITGTEPPDVAITLTVAITKANIENAKIELTFDSMNGYLGAGNPYFTYKGVQPLASDTIFESVTDNGNGIVTIKIKDKVPLNSLQSVDIIYEYDKANYDGIPQPDEMLAKISAKTFIDTEVVSTNPEVQIKSNTTHQRLILTQPHNPTSTEAIAPNTFKIFSTQRVTLRYGTVNSNYYTNLLDENYPHNVKVYIPEGTEVFGGTTSTAKYTTHLGVNVLANEVEGLAAGKYDLLMWEWHKPANDPTKFHYYNYGGNRSNSFDQNDFVFKFPSGAVNGTEHKVIGVMEYLYKGAVTPRKAAYPVTYIVDDTSRWNFITPLTNGTGSAQQSFCGINNGDKTSAFIANGFGYANAQTNRNAGSVPIKNVEMIVYHVEDRTTAPKLNFDGIEVVASRENETVPWSQFDVYFDVVNAKTGKGRITSEDKIRIIPTSLKNQEYINIGYRSVVKLTDGEYIDKIHLIPMGADGNSAGELPPMNSITLRYSFMAWPEQKWPNGTAVSSMNLVPMKYDLKYDNKDDVATTGFGKETLARYQSIGPFAGAVITPISSNKDSVVTEDVVSFSIKGTNSRTAGANDVWAGPVVAVAMPSGIKLNTASPVTAKNQSGTIIPVTVETVDETAGISHYKFKLDPNYSIHYTPTTNDFTILFEAKTPAGIAAGKYSLSAVLTADAGANFYMGNPVLHNNASSIAYGEASTAYGLSPSDNFTASPTHPQFTVINKVNAGAGSLIQSQKMVNDEGGDPWTSNTVAAANFNDEVKMKLVITNKGNSPLTKLKLYDIIPFDGYNPEPGSGLVSSGSVTFEEIMGLPAGATVKYYDGVTAPPLSDITTAGFASGWTGTKDNATGIYTDFGAAVVPVGGTLELTLKFKVPNNTSQQQTAFNRFIISYDPGNGQVSTATSATQGFSTHYYAMTFVNGGDTTITKLPANITGSFGTDNTKDVTVPADKPEKKYYTFQYWEDTTGTKYNPGDTYTFNVILGKKELELKPIFARNDSFKYKINYHANGGTGSITPSFLDVFPGDTIAMPNLSALVNPGMKLNNTAVSPLNTTPDGLGNYWNFSTTVPESSNDIDLYVNWVVDASQKVDLSFDVNAAHMTNKPTTPTASSVIIMQPVGALPDFGEWADGTSKYKHLGWATSNTAIAPDFNKDSKITANTTVFAVWQTTVVTVTFDAGTGGTLGNVSTFAMSVGNPIPKKTLPIADTRNVNNPASDAHHPDSPTKKGYVFMGWSETAGTTTAGFTVGMLDTLKVDKTLHAAWKIDEYIVTMHGNGNDTGNAGTADPADPVGKLQFNYGNAGGLTLPDSSSPAPKKKGSILKGWATTQALANAGTADFTNAKLATITANTDLWAVWTKEQFNLSFDLDYTGAPTPPTAISVRYDVAVTGLATPKRSGFFFKNWEIDGTAFAEGTKYPFTASKTAKATWTANKYTLTTYDNINPASQQVVQNLSNLAHGNLPALTPATRPTYDFKGWSKTPTGGLDFLPGATIVLDDSWATPPATLIENGQSFKLYAVWTINQYKVNFNRNHDSADINVIGTVDPAEHNKPFASQTPPSRSGYTFKGWSKTKTAGTPDFVAGANITINSSFGNLPNGATIELYAVWKANRYNLVMYDNIVPAAQKELERVANQPHNSTVTPAKPVRAYYVFKGWAKSPAGMVDFAPNAAVTLNDTMAVSPATLLADGQDVKLYAVWSINEYTIVFNRNHSPSDNNIVATLNNIKHDTNFASQTPALRPGYTFKGWSKTSAATSAVFAVGANIKVDNTFGALQNAATINFYAVWEAKGFTLTFDKNTGDNEPTPKSKSVKFDQPYGDLPVNVTKTGYTFAGWTSTKDDKNTLVNKNQLYKTDANSTLFALWTIDEYSVQFDANGGVLAAGTTNRTIKYNNPVGAMPADPTRVGYIFKGWNTQVDASGKVVDAALLVTENMVAYANWEIIKYDVEVQIFKYNYNETAAQAVQVGTSKKLKIDHGSYYDASADMLNEEDYNFDADSSTKPLLVQNITTDTVIKLYYKHITYTPTMAPTLECIVNDRNPFKDNSIKTLDELLKEANFKITSDKVSGTRAAARISKGSATIDSVNFKDLDFSQVTLGYDQEVDVEIAWPSGQKEVLTVKVKISDKTAPEIHQNAAQKYELYFVESVEAIEKIKEQEKQFIDILKLKIVVKPKTEAEFLKLVKELGINVTDNYDNGLEPIVTYLNGSFENVKWANGDSFIIYLNALDSSNNAAVEQAAIIKTFNKLLDGEFGEGGNEHTGGGKGPGGNNVDTNYVGPGAAKGADTGRLNASEIDGLDSIKEKITGRIPSALLPKTGGFVGIVTSPIFVICLLLLLAIVIVISKAISKKRKEASI